MENIAQAAWQYWTIWCRCMADILTLIAVMLWVVAGLLLLFVSGWDQLAVFCLVALVECVLDRWILVACYYDSIAQAKALGTEWYVSAEDVKLEASVLVLLVALVADAVRVLVVMDVVWTL